MKREPLTYDDIFGQSGMIPLYKTCLKANCVCPHCNHVIQNICFPPPGMISVHTCPVCSNSVIPFAGRLIPVDIDVVNTNESQEHIAKCIFVALSNTFMGVILDCGFKLTARRTGQFLNDCYEVIFQVVGEREDEEAFMGRLRKAFLALKSNKDVRPEVIESVYGFLMNMTKSYDRLNKKPIISEGDVEELTRIDSVDDFLKKYFKEKKDDNKKKE